MSIQQRFIQLPFHDDTRWTHIKTALNQQHNSAIDLQNLLKNLSNIETNVFEYLSLDPQFFSHVLPYMKNLIFLMPSIFPNHLPILLDTDLKLNLTRKQVASLMCCAFFDIIVQPAVLFPDLQFNPFTFRSLYLNGLTTKITFLIQYFSDFSRSEREGFIIIQRKKTEPENTPNWAQSVTLFQQNLVAIQTTGKIEDCNTCPYHVDFANKFIGGRVFETGALQEEISFLIKPECIVSMLFCPAMADNEAIIISGAERFSSYRGYGTSFEFTGPHHSHVDVSKTHIIAIDALVAYSKNQFDKEIIDRELTKAYVGFRDLSKDDQPLIATGNWGCGAFGGNKVLKFLEQAIAAAEANVSLSYFLFESGKLKSDLDDILQKLSAQRVTVGQLHRILTEFGTRPVDGLIPYLHRRLGGSSVDDPESVTDNHSLAAPNTNWFGNIFTVFVGWCWTSLRGLVRSPK